MISNEIVDGEVLGVCPRSMDLKIEYKFFNLKRLEESRKVYNCVLLFSRTKFKRGNHGKGKNSEATRFEDKTAEETGD